MIPTLQLICGDALEELRRLPENSVHCCVTSVPYWGLRDYGTAKWEGGDATCDHRKETIRRNLAEAANACDGGNRSADNRSDKDALGIPFRDVCGKCGAKRTDRQIGLEDTPELWVAKLVEVFREVRRVLHPSGTLWLNIGDAYSSGDRATFRSGASENKGQDILNDMPRPKTPAGLKPKDLLGLPWSLAFALRSDGWWLRSEIIWAKRAPMPESVTDRPTSATEKIFLLTKSEHYFYDSEAVKEPVSGDAHMRRANGPNSRMVVERVPGRENSKPNPSRSNIPGVCPKSAPAGSGIKSNESFQAAVTDLVGSRNMRNFWLLGPEPFDGAHFAVFPSEIPKRAILAGTSAKGVCPRCGEPWLRIVEDGAPDLEHQRACGGDTNGEYFGRSQKDYESANAQDASATKARILKGMVEKKTVGWKAECDCSLDPVPATVLDPFGGVMTTACVALELGRNSISIELSPAYVELGKNRIAGITPGFPTLA